MKAFSLSLMLWLPVATAAAQSLRDSPTTAAPAKTGAPPVSAPAPSAAEKAGREIPVGEELQRTITKLVLEQVPHEYENKKKWGGTKKTMSGLDWELDGVRVETRRQFREANHGSWSMYRLRLLDEDEFQVRLENLRDIGDSTAECDLIVVAHLDCFARMAEWRRGVQLFSLSAEGKARTRFKAHLAVKMGLDPRTLPPDIVVAPEVKSAEIVLEELKLERVGQADGPLVRQLSDLVEHEIDDYLESYREKLVQKMNQQINRKPEKLRIPLSQLTSSPWGSWFTSYFQRKK